MLCGLKHLSYHARSPLVLEELCPHLCSQQPEKCLLIKVTWFSWLHHFLLTLISLRCLHLLFYGETIPPHLSLWNHMCLFLIFESISIHRRGRWGFPSSSSLSCWPSMGIFEKVWVIRPKPCPQSLPVHTKKTQELSPQSLGSAET